MSTLKILLLVILAAIMTASIGFAAEKKFKAKLTGEEVPSVKTKAKGDAEFKLSNDGKEMTYTVNVKNIENATAAHIHKGRKGENGPPVAGLFAGPKKSGKFNGVLSQGTIRENDLMGELQGKPLDALVDLIKAGDAYVNVHTDTHPDGELRGQIK